MKNIFKIAAAGLCAAAAVACSSAAKMAELAENVKVQCNPAVLEVVAGEIDATVSVTYPDGYFHPNAILEVIPVLLYEGGEAEMEPFMYQGEKVKDNYKAVSSKGQTVRERVHFDYVEGMESARLVLRGKVKYKNKSWDLPIKKVADGCNTTYMLVEAEGNIPYKADNYQEILVQTEEGQILYGINSSDVSGKEINSKSVKDFQAALDEIKSNSRKTLTGTEVVAYASPDGGKDLNTKLSDKRSKSAGQAFDKVTKGKDTGETTVKSVGQDWEGFQELVAKSDIEDKDLILRVLNMYSDPAVRESEIKNISEVYTSLKSSVLPELRRARFIANVEYQNYSSEELLALVEDNTDVLDEEALLRAASLVKDNSKKIDLYRKAADKYDSDRARFNLGVALLKSGKIADAGKAFASVKEKDADIENALGVVALRNNELDAAAKHFKKAGTEASARNQAVVDILRGEYDKAAAALKNETGFNAALAQILVDNPQAASKALTCQCPRSNYLRAIIAARQGDAEAVADCLDKAGKVKALAERAEKDVEFAQYR
ncbi:MAG: hypothetical protein IJ795_04555 [Bacteroidales bacterium]|nr:hypothetical protein [Bacteroidales bacterium]